MNAAELESDTRGHVRLDQAGDDVDRGTLRGEDHVHAAGSGHLGQAHDAALDVLLGDHHQVGELVDHDDDVGHRVGRTGGGPSPGQLLGAYLRAFSGVQFLSSRSTFLLKLTMLRVLPGGEQLVAALHLATGPRERRCRRLGGLGDDRDAAGAARRRRHLELEHLGVDEEQAELVGRAREQQAHEHAVDAHALAGAGGAADRAGGASSPGRRHHGLALDVLADDDGQLRHLVFAEGSIDGQHLAEVDGHPALGARDLDADDALAGDRRDDADADLALAAPCARSSPSDWRCAETLIAGGRQRTRRS